LLYQGSSPFTHCATSAGHCATSAGHCATSAGHCAISAGHCATSAGSKNFGDGLFHRNVKCIFIYFYFIEYEGKAKFQL
jgi:hypothetical protein